MRLGNIVHIIRVRSIYSAIQCKCSGVRTIRRIRTVVPTTPIATPATDTAHTAAVARRAQVVDAAAGEASHVGALPVAAARVGAAHGGAGVGGEAGVHDAEQVRAVRDAQDRDVVHQLWCRVE